MLMSKDTPEVGDVWEFKYGFDRLYVTKTNLIGEDKLERIRALKKLDDGHFVQREYYTNGFIEDHTYLGKSKANINDLFKTENEDVMV